MKLVTLLALIGVLSVAAKNAMNHYEFMASINKRSVLVKDTSILPKHESAKLQLRHDVTKMHRADAKVTHQVIISVKEANLDKLEALVNDIADPFSANFGKHLSKKEVTEMTANPASTHHVTQFLKMHDVKIVKTTSGGEYITAEAPIAKWEELLQTQFFHYDVAGESRTFLRAAHYSLPKALAGHVNSVFRVSDFPSPVAYRGPYVRPEGKMNAKKQDTSTASTLGAQQANGLPSCKLGAQWDNMICPPVINTYYDVRNNTGNVFTTQAIFASLNQSYSPTDLTAFQKFFNTTVQPIAQDIGGHAQNDACVADNGGDCIEANLDVQYIMAVSQVTPTTFYYTDADFIPWITVVANMANPPKIFSISYAGPEDQYTDSELNQFNTEAMKLAAQGVTLLAASGDDGATIYYARTKGEFCGYYPFFPAASPYVTAVGGTQNAEINQPEQPCLAQTSNGGISTGGGFSNHIGPQSWQAAALQIYRDTMTSQGISYGPGVNWNNRGYPDVAMAANLFIINANNKWRHVDGTSASSPSFAGFVGLVNAARAKAGKSALGWINPSLYALSSQIILNDPDTGKNNCAAGADICCEAGYNAAKGWDPLTGIGSVNFTKFLNVFEALGDSPNNPTLAPTTAAGVPSANPTVVPTLAPTAKPTARPTLGPQGWFYSTEWQNTQCTGTKYAQFGSPVGQCVTRYNLATGEAVGSTMTTCDNEFANFNMYSTTNCLPVSWLGARKVVLNVCDVQSDEFTTSESFMCTTSTALPLSPDEWILQYEYDWHTDHTCDGQPNYFTAFKNNYCAKASATSSAFFGYPDVTIYNTSGTCTGTSMTVNLQTECQVIDGDDQGILNDDTFDLSYAAVSMLYNNLPTATPTAMPSLPQPTAQPSQNDLINFAAQQVISGISLATYNSNATLYGNTLKKSIAQCMTGVAPSNIINLIVTAAADPQAVATAMRRALQGSNSISAVYQVNLHSTSTNYGDLSSQLSSAVSQGTFDSNLHANAASSGATGFSAATSTAVTTRDLTSSDDDSDDKVLSDGAIAGIAIGGFIALVLIVGAVWYVVVGRKRPSDLNENLLVQPVA